MYGRLGPGLRREQILDAANALVAERTDEVSIEDIARSADVARGLVHHYFGGRKEVCIAVLERLGAQRERRLRLQPTISPSRSISPCCAACDGSRGHRGRRRFRSRPRGRGSRRRLRGCLVRRGESTTTGTGGAAYSSPQRPAPGSPR
jgi:AcrR family transcriptional regulator